MDVDEVTNAAYKACIRTGACPRGGPLYNDFSRDAQPIVGPSWFGAVAFCEHAGKHLPTEAQWEKAARGPDGALYPWGDEPTTCERAVIQDERGRSCGVKKLKEHPDKGRTFEVGSRPPGVYGLRDMMGNSWEWVADWASESWAACGEACAGVDPRGPCGGEAPCRGHTERVVRGGSWYWSAKYATGAYRRSHVPDNPISNFHHFGFRCAASVEEAAGLAAGAPVDSAVDDGAGAAARR
jgi:formylglycine-generating enzyme required for sulfatase activity